MKVVYDTLTATSKGDRTMFGKLLKNVIVINDESKTIKFYALDKEKKNSAENFIKSDESVFLHGTQGYNAPLFSDAFFENFGQVLAHFCQCAPHRHIQKISLVLPNRVFITDIINIPVIRRRAVNNPLELALRSIYKNIDDIEYSFCKIAENRQFITFAVIGIRRFIIEKFRIACAEQKISVSSITFSANAAMCAAITLRPKLKNTSFALLDIKEKSSVFSMICKGKTLAFYTIPFGFSALLQNEASNERNLTDHTPAETVVFEARAAATSKRSGNANEQGSWPEGAEHSSVGVKAMINRETCGASTEKKENTENYHPVIDKGFLSENYKIFVKWVDEVCQSNQDILRLARADRIYVSLPKKAELVLNICNICEKTEFTTSIPMQVLPLFDLEKGDEITDAPDALGGAFVREYCHYGRF